jgi:hypothetical protein
MHADSGIIWGVLDDIFLSFMLGHGVAPAPAPGEAGKAWTTVNRPAFPPRPLVFSTQRLLWSRNLRQDSLESGTEKGDSG